MFDMTRIPILVTGSHKAGTTWVGEMLAASRRVGYISEPFNPTQLLAYVTWSDKYGLGIFRLIHQKIVQLVILQEPFPTSSALPRFARENRALRIIARPSIGLVISLPTVYAV